MTDEAEQTNDGTRIVIEYSEKTDRWTATTEILKVGGHGVESVRISRSGSSPFGALAFLEDAIVEEEG